MYRDETHTPLVGIIASAPVAERVFVIVIDHVVSAVLLWSRIYAFVGAKTRKKMRRELRDKMIRKTTRG